MPDHKKRWKVTFSYRLSDGTTMESSCEVDELNSFPTIVEQAPNWWALVKIEIVYQLGDGVTTL